MRIIILLMSCARPLYEIEEDACRETFLKDAEAAGIEYWFYKGLDDAHPGQTFDERTRTLHVDAPDDLAGTGRKTIAALKAISGRTYDYVIKTNVSTYLDIGNITRGMRDWEGAGDHNIYGGRFIVNRFSKHVPFPRGYLTILSRDLVEGIIPVAERLSGQQDIPVTDDTLLGLSLLYHVQKTSGERYIDKLREVPSVTAWDKDITDAPDYKEAFAIRCKDEGDKGRTPENMRAVREARLGGLEGRHHREPRLMETPYGPMTYERYCALLGKARVNGNERIT